MRIAMLSPIAWRTPPRHYGPWESVVSLLNEELVSRGFDVTLFATGDSETSGKLHAICAQGYEEDLSIIPKVWECLHISELFEHAKDFDIIHNNFDFLPLTYTGLITTPVVTTIHGIDIKQFDFQPEPDDYLLFFGRIHHDKGAREALEIARACNKKLIMAGIIQDEAYYHQYVEPHLHDHNAVYVGSVGPVQRNRLLGKAYALLHPINFNEPFGLSVVESMACGTPVIAFDKGSMPELIENGKNGFLVKTVDEAVDAAARIKDIDRACCRRRVEQYFTIDRMVEEYIQVYETVLEKTKREEYRPWGYYKILADNDTYKSKE